MEKIKTFLDKWVKFVLYDTEVEGVYQIYVGISKDGKEVELSKHGFNLYFGNSKSVTINYQEYGFSSVDSFKRATVLSLYYISRLSAEEIVGQYIVNAIRKGKELKSTDVRKYISEGKSEGCPEKWSVYIDLRQLV